MHTELLEKICLTPGPGDELIQPDGNAFGMMSIASSEDKIFTGKESTDPGGCRREVAHVRHGLRQCGFRR